MDMVQFNAAVIHYSKVFIFVRIAALVSQIEVILDGVHYLHDGDTVNAFERVEVSL